MHWRAAVKIAYDGRRFMGSQRQPGLNTVEGEMIAALSRIDAIDSAELSNFAFASRTDRGVSALGNVAAFDTEFSISSLMQALNANSKNIFYTAIAKVPDEFSPRYAKGRWYRYLLPVRGRDEDLLTACMKTFEGEHDFTHFCKPDGKNPIKTIDKVTVVKTKNMFVIDIFAREFLRNMIRRMIAAADDVSKGHGRIQDVESALNGNNRTFGLAPPEPLTLMDIRYDFEFQKECTPAFIKKSEDYSDDACCRIMFAKMLRDQESIIR